MKKQSDVRRMLRGALLILRATVRSTLYNNKINNVFVFNEAPGNGYPKPSSVLSSNYWRKDIIIRNTKIS